MLFCGIVLHVLHRILWRHNVILRMVGIWVAVKCLGLRTGWPAILGRAASIDTFNVRLKRTSWGSQLTNTHDSSTTTLIWSISSISRERLQIWSCTSIVYTIITYNHYNIHKHPLEIHIQQGRTALSAENGAFAAASLMRGFVRAISKDLSATNVSTQRRIWSAAAQHFNCFEITTEWFEQTTTRTVKQIRVDYKK
jgi:hypothetical protein